MILQTIQAICGLVKSDWIWIDLYALEADGLTISSDSVGRCRFFCDIHRARPFFAVIPHLMPDARFTCDEHPVLSQCLETGCQRFPPVDTVMKGGCKDDRVPPFRWKSIKVHGFKSRCRCSFVPSNAQLLSLLDHRSAHVCTR